MLQEPIKGTLPTHLGPRCRRLKGLGLLDQLVLREMLSRRLLSPQNSSVPALLLGSDQTFLDGDTRAFKPQIDNFKIFEVKPLRERINQLLTREQHLISSLSNEPIGLGRKSWRETLGDPAASTQIVLPMTGRTSFGTPRCNWYPLRALRT